MTDPIIANKDQKPIVAASTIRSHSVSGDLPGVQSGPDHGSPAIDN
jgi:hypothetical protein